MDKAARARISLFDDHGLIEPHRADLFDFQKPCAHPHPRGGEYAEANGLGDEVIIFKLLNLKL